jgi:hypothetical protein
MIMFQFKKQESYSGLEFDHRWRRSFKLGAVTVFETIRIIAYKHSVYENGEVPRLIYFRGVGLDENYQRRLGKLGNSSTTPLMYLITLMWTSLYVILGRILTKEYVILNAEHEREWQQKWPFAADSFVSVRREKKLKEIGI